MPLPVKSVRLDNDLIEAMKTSARYLAYVRKKPVNWVEVLREAGWFYAEHLRKQESSMPPPGLPTP